MVLCNSNLRSVKDQYNQTQTHQGRELTRDQCSALVFSPSKNYDSHFTSTTSKASHRSHSTET